MFTSTDKTERSTDKTEPPQWISRLEEVIPISNTADMSLFMKRGGSKKEEARNRREACTISRNYSFKWFSYFVRRHNNILQVKKMSQKADRDGDSKLSKEEWL